MKTATGFILCALLFASAAYGYAVSMTLEGFPIQGYIGACIPAVFLIGGIGLGMLLIANRGGQS